MEIRLLEKNDKKTLERFLRPRADSSMLLRSNAALQGLVNEGERHQGAYVGAFDGRSLVGVVAHFNIGNLIPQAPVELLPELVETALEASGRELRGAIGPEDQVAVVLDTAGVDLGKVQIDSREGLYSMDMRSLRRPGALAAQRIQGRAIEAGDRKLLVSWFNAYDVETLGGTPGCELTRQSEERFDRTLANGNGYLLLRDGEPVATSGFNATLPDAVQIGGVYTPPAERRRGFARAIVAHSLEAVREHGVERATLFTDDGNVAAITAYRALGFDRVGDFRLTLLA